MFDRAVSPFAVLLICAFVAITQEMLRRHAVRAARLDERGKIMREILATEITPGMRSHLSTTLIEMFEASREMIANNVFKEGIPRVHR
jgi:hypothetical protein